MGKRKSRKIQAKAAAPKCDTVFDCPYCSHRQTIEVQLLRKDGIGKLFCRICGYKYQKRLGPLDKQVDIYCAMIDDAEALNAKKQNDGIGFLARDEYDDEAQNGEEDDFGASKPTKVETGNLLQEIRRRGAGTITAGDEEEKFDPEALTHGRINTKVNDPLSERQKIAEMGLSRPSSETVQKTLKKEDLKEFGAIMTEKAEGIHNGDNQDSDSDDLF